jgi:hypothetical protein
MQLKSSSIIVDMRVDNKGGGKRGTPGTELSSPQAVPVTLFPIPVTTGLRVGPVENKLPSKIELTSSWRYICINCVTTGVMMRSVFEKAWRVT